jgi:hypothetical protein
MSLPFVVVTAPVSLSGRSQIRSNESNIPFTLACQGHTHYEHLTCAYQPTLTCANRSKQHLAGVAGFDLPTTLRPTRRRRPHDRRPRPRHRTQQGTPTRQHRRVPLSHHPHWNPLQRPHSRSTQSARRDARTTAQRHHREPRKRNTQLCRREELQVPPTSAGRPVPDAPPQSMT